MALSATAITQAILASGATTFPGSQDLPKIARAVGQSIISWAPVIANVRATGITAGLAGGGSVNGKVFFSSPRQMVTFLNQAGLAGVTSAPLGNIVENGLVSILNASIQYTGLSTGVGSGTDAMRISIANPATLTPILLANLQGSGIFGLQAGSLATGLSNGISSIFLTGVGTGIVVGIAGTTPGTGTSISSVF